MQKTVPAAELYFSAIPDMDKVGEKTLVAIYNKTFKGELAATLSWPTPRSRWQADPVDQVTQQPTRRTYYVYTSAPPPVWATARWPSTPRVWCDATYGNGETSVIDNAKLTFSPVTASAAHAR